MQSVTIEPPVLHEDGCTPVTQPVPKDLSPTWGTFARACEWSPRGICADPGKVCSPSGPPDGFRTCIAHEGDVSCPSYSPYQERHVFYEGLDDTRTCSPCSCGAPEGGSCSGLISVYADGACSALLSSTLVTSAGALCADVAAGSALGSKSAGPVTYTPGTCTPSGGEPMGTAEPRDAVTLCCLP